MPLDLAKSISFVGWRTLVRIISATVAALVSWLLILPIAAGAVEPPKGFRSITWGSSPSSGLKKMAGPNDGVTMYVPASSKSPPPLFELPIAEEVYSFSKGKFYSGSAWLDGQETFEKMKAVLTKTYGQPSFANERLKLWKWKWPGTQIEVHLSYQTKFSRTTVTFVNNGI